MREIGLGAVPIPVVLHFHAAKRRPGLGQPLIEGDRPLGVPARHRHRLVDLQRPQHRRRCHQQVGRREPGMGHGIVGIEHQRLFEQGQRLDQRQPRERLEMGPRLELQEVGLRRPRAVAVHVRVDGQGRRLRQRRRDARGDRVLQGGAVHRGLLELLAPFGAAARHLDQARRDAQPLGAALHRALQQMFHAERAGAGQVVHGLDRRDGDARHAAQRRGHGVGNTDPEIAVGLGQVGRREGPHGKRLGGGDRRRARGLRTGLRQRHGPARPGDSLRADTVSISVGRPSPSVLRRVDMWTVSVRSSTTTLGHSLSRNVLCDTSRPPASTSSTRICQALPGTASRRPSRVRRRSARSRMKGPNAYTDMPDGFAQP